MKVLLIAAHPDDETLSCFHVLLATPDASILYVSSGVKNEIEKREMAVISALKDVGNFKHFFLRGADDHLDKADEIMDFLMQYGPDEVWYPAFEKHGHRLHNEINIAINNEIQKFRSLGGNWTGCHEYLCYGRKSLTRTFATIVNVFLKPFKCLMGFTPEFEKGTYPRYTYHFSKKQSQMKMEAITIYRKIMGEPFRRLVRYKQESWK